MQECGDAEAAVEKKKGPLHKARPVGPLQAANTEHRLTFISTFVSLSPPPQIYIYIYIYVYFLCASEQVLKRTASDLYALDGRERKKKRKCRNSVVANNDLHMFDDHLDTWGCY